MQLHFLLGPAGTGKTFQCLHEIRQALKASPDGLPLVFLAPKQATFQLEYELLSDPELPGYTRLKIVSFDKLAELILQECSPAAPKLLNEEGRVMVLRALLAQRYSELKVFQSTARLPGFAQHLSQLMSELQHHQFSPERLLAVAAQSSTVPQLAEKLQDLALLLRAYQEWLHENQLQDPDSLLSLAADMVKQAARRGEFHLGGLWLDGFAEMTPQELDLLAGLVPACERATLAFCLGAPPKPGDQDWLSIWGTVGQTFQACHARLTSLPDVVPGITILPRRPDQSRFENNPVLAHLERNWSKPQPFASNQQSTINNQLSLYACPNPEAEAVAAAREILRHVQAGGRFREAAVLVRSLDSYHHVLRRVFTRYEIPFFLDRRESISHHPLPELTRYALRLALYGWEHDDWFGALKTGLVHENALLIDRLENAALAHGWRGREFWRNPLQLDQEKDLEKALEAFRQEIIPPFSHWAERLQQTQSQPTGPQLAAALRELWEMLNVSATLQTWSEATGEANDFDSILHANIHGAVRQEMERWLQNLELAFAHTPFPLADWLGVVDAGLASLTVGVVPPALDQVLVGAVDRSRNPDLKVLIALGLNEMVFPAPPPPPVLLSEPDRKALADAGVMLGPDQRQQIGRERFLGYIVCTRARDRVVATYAHRDRKDKPLNPSLFIGHLQQLFPGLQAQEFGPLDWRESLHSAELVVPLLQNHSLSNPNLNLSTLEQLPLFQPVLGRWNHIAQARSVTCLSSGLAEKLYGPTLATSISDLEEYAACPFKFFVRRGLKAEERQEFEIDARERGSFQHEIMMAFHRRLQAQGRRWRDIGLAEARELIGRIGEELQESYRQGLFASTPERQFQARLLIQGLQDLVEVLAGWAPQYQFEPRAVEIGFGAEEGGLKPWRIELGPAHALLLRGRIDRVDIHLRADGAADVVVIDYKSSGQELKEIKLLNGLDLQLLAYLGVLRDEPDATRIFSASKLIPAGAFYVRLRRGGSSGVNRMEVLAEREGTFKKTYQHRGRFAADLLRQFDNRDTPQGDQFKYSLKDNGELKKAGNEALLGDDFARLVDKIQNFLRGYGQEIYAGRVSVAPYRLNRETACDHCQYGSLCRFDGWVEPYRILKKEGPLIKSE